MMISILDREVLFRLGLKELRMKQYKISITTLTEALQFNHDDKAFAAKIYSNRSLAHLLVKDYGMALR